MVMMTVMTYNWSMLLLGPAQDQLRRALPARWSVPGDFGRNAVAGLPLFLQGNPMGSPDKFDISSMAGHSSDYDSVCFMHVSCMFLVWFVYVSFLELETQAKSRSEADPSSSPCEVRGEYWQSLYYGIVFEWYYHYCSDLFWLYIFCFKYFNYRAFRKCFSWQASVGTVYTVVLFLWMRAAEVIQFYQKPCGSNTFSPAISVIPHPPKQMLQPQPQIDSPHSRWWELLLVAAAVVVPRRDAASWAVVISHIGL